VTKEHKEMRQAVTPLSASDSQEASTAAEGRRKPAFTTVLAVLAAVLSLAAAMVSIRPVAAATNSSRTRSASRC